VLLSCEGPQLLTDRSKKGLHNILTHHIPRGSAVAQLTMDRPLCGLVEAYYSDLDFGGRSKLVDEHTKLVVELLDDWSARR
jgi:hypothetical protein